MFISKYVIYESRGVLGVGGGVDTYSSRTLTKAIGSYTLPKNTRLYVFHRGGIIILLCFTLCFPPIPACNKVIRILRNEPDSNVLLREVR